MNIQAKSPAAPVRSQVSPEEWDARVQLAACYRLIAHYQFTDLIYNHATLRAPGGHQHFLINPYGLFFSEVTASSLHKIDLDGNVVMHGDMPLGINRAGYVIHSAIHRARPDAACIIHTHTKWDVAVSAMKCGLLPISQTALRFQGRIGHHAYEGPATDLDEQKRLVANLGKNDVLLLHNHGALVCGRTVSEAFFLLHRFQTACQIQIDVMTAGQEILYPSKEAQERTRRMFNPATGDKDVAVSGEMEWKAFMRLLDQKDTSYKL